jgi:diguanylate cyclase (GGDEF)-like protein
MVATGFDEYQTRITQGVRSVLAEAGHSVVVYTCDPFFPDLSPSLVRHLRETTPIGAITTNCVTPEQEQQLDELLAERGVPTVRVGAYQPGTTCVHGDNFTGMRALMAHLLDECGSRRPVLVRGLTHQRDSAEREAVFREELAARGLAVDEGLVLEGRFTHDVTYSLMRDLLRRRRDFDAVVAANDLSALGAHAALTDEGLRVPEDVLVTGFDNEKIARMNWPGLTTIDQNLEQQGSTAARQLLAELDGGPDAGELVVPSFLVVRGSTGALPAEGLAETAISVARMAQAQLAEQDAVIGLNRGMIQCRALEDLAGSLGGRQLERLGITRCFVAIFEEHMIGSEVRNLGPGASRLILDYRDGEVTKPPDEIFADHQLLPRDLRGELDRGGLVCQPLSVSGQFLGYVLFEQARGLVTATEVLRMDLTRTLEAVFSTMTLQQHAENLEHLVAKRTRELETEVLTRRRAEEELKSEVSTRRQAQQELQGEVTTRRRAERELQRLNSELQRSVLLDGLTRIGNRTAFTQQLAQFWEQGRPGDQIALLLVDVDLFKAYNDRYGHLMGDETLCGVASALSAAVRYPQDLACRYGGEEFAAVLPNSGAASAMVVAQRFQGLLTAAAIPHAASTVATIVTASTGVAVLELGPDVRPNDLIEAADQALYRAKAAGRNQICLAGAEVTAGG